MVNSFCRRKDSFKTSACRWCWQDPPSTHAQLEPYVLLSTPIIAEHIKSTVSRADVAVEFSAQCTDAAPRTELCWWIHWMRRWTKHQTIADIAAVIPHLRYHRRCLTVTVVVPHTRYRHRGITVKFYPSYGNYRCYRGITAFPITVSLSSAQKSKEVTIRSHHPDTTPMPTMCACMCV